MQTLLSPMVVLEKNFKNFETCNNICWQCSSKDCKGKDSRHPSCPCEFQVLLRAQNADKSTQFYFSPSEVLCKSGITINIFCGNFLIFLQIESIIVLGNPSFFSFSLFLFPFWEFFSVSFYTPTTMKTRLVRGVKKHANQEVSDLLIPTVVPTA